MKGLTAIVSALFLSTSSLSAETRIMPDGYAFTLFTKHTESTADFEVRNPGVFLTWDGTYLNTRAGVFRNSFGKVSTSISFDSDFLSLSIDKFSANPFWGIAHYPGDGRNQIVSISGSDWIPLLGARI